MFTQSYTRLDNSLFYYVRSYISVICQKEILKKVYEWKICLYLLMFSFYYSVKLRKESNQINNNCIISSLLN